MSVLKQVVTGRKLKPLAIIFHAPRGIGKSTFASESPNPIYIGTEENDELDVARLPRVESFKQLNEQLAGIRDDEHDYKTLVIDTVDGLEPVLAPEFLKGKNAKYTIETYLGGYGKGGKELAKIWEKIKREYIIPIREKRKMNVVLLCHSKIRKHEDPMTGAGHDVFETAMHNGVKPVWEDWVSAILFANFQLFKIENDDGKVRVEGDGARMIYTEERPSHAAKNRFNLDYEIEFEKTGTWNKVRKEVIKHFKTAKKETEEKGEDLNTEADEIKKAISEMLPKIPEEIQGAIKTAIGRAKGDIGELNRVLTKAKKLLN